jgi:hypothetical protein
MRVSELDITWELNKSVRLCSISHVQVFRIHFFSLSSFIDNQILQISYSYRFILGASKDFLEIASDQLLFTETLICNQSKVLHISREVAIESKNSIILLNSRTM